MCEIEVCWVVVDTLAVLEDPAGGADDTYPAGGMDRSACTGVAASPILACSAWKRKRMPCAVFVTRDNI